MLSGRRALAWSVLKFWAKIVSCVERPRIVTEAALCRLAKPAAYLLTTRNRTPRRWMDKIVHRPLQAERGMFIDSLPSPL